MRYLIAIPCMDTVHTLFMTSLLAMERPEGTEIGVCSSSLVYDSRNKLSEKAVNEGFDRVLWLDSDMVFGPDLMERLAADLDEGRQFVTALYFTRKKPIRPCVYKRVETVDRGLTRAESYTDYPKDSVFEVAGCGFGACMLDTSVLRAAGVDRRPFSPMDGFGEDFSFELKAKAQGVTLYCDSRIKASHIGLSIIDESTWEGLNK